jgi:hypothetical protein
MMNCTSGNRRLSRLQNCLRWLLSTDMTTSNDQATGPLQGPVSRPSDTEHSVNTIPVTVHTGHIASTPDCWGRSVHTPMSWAVRPAARAPSGSRHAVSSSACWCATGLAA